jgi:hypothetical protein
MRIGSIHALDGAFDAMLLGLGRKGRRAILSTFGAIGMHWISTSKKGTTWRPG